MKNNKIRLSKITIDISKIKSLNNKKRKLVDKYNKEIKPHYFIEFIDGTCLEITKQEYKLLRGVINNEY